MPSEEQSDTTTAAPIDRRQLVKKAAVGGAVAWTAPMVLSLGASAAAASGSRPGCVIPDLGRSAVSPNTNDGWEAILVIDLSALFSYTNAGAPITVIPNRFRFDTGPSTLTNTSVQPFVILNNQAGNVVSVGTAQTGLTLSTSYDVLFGGSSFVLGTGQTMIVGFTSTATGGAPVAFNFGSSSNYYLVGGPAASDAASLPAVPPGPISLGGTTSVWSDPPGVVADSRDYYYSATFTCTP